MPEAAAGKAPEKAPQNQAQSPVRTDIINREIEEEMKSSYLDYAMSVLVSRALPDVRDGLKPVQRRILFAMLDLGLQHNKPFRKCARIVGDCLGKYHPHGDSAVFEALVRMAQGFSLRYPLVEGQGNFGCFTKDTKIRLTDGRSLNFEELIREQAAGKRHWAFSFNNKEKKVEIAEIKHPRLTRKNAELVEVELDNGEKIRCTPDHRFMLRDGSYRDASALKPDESLMPFYSKLCDGADDKSMAGYLLAYQPFKDEWQFVHRLADEWNLQQGAYEKAAGRIRHHLDFNKLNNNPDNIKRLQWEAHWKIHADMASFRHKNDFEYVKKLAAGRKRFIEKNKDILSQRASKRNKLLWQNSEFRKEHTARMKALWEDKEYKETMRKASSRNLKLRWQREDFRELLRGLKSKELKQRWQGEKYREKMRVHMKNISLKLWEDSKHREKMSRIAKERMSNPKWKKKQSSISKLLWENPGYRAKYSKDHFSKMAKALWSDEKIMVLHREKAVRQWQDQAFREKVGKNVVASNKCRLEKNSGLMKEMAEKAKVSLHRNWQNPEYKKRVLRSKILKYASGLIKKHKTLNPELYEKERIGNYIPKFANALRYFDNFESLVAEAKTYNHKVVRVTWLNEKENVYDLTVEPWHNFLLDAGVFVHNSVDGDSAAAMRYVEARMSPIAELLLEDIDKETVDFVKNFDGSLEEPVVLPGRFPNLLVNGSSGIAVGMATNIPPHNLKEVISAITAIIKNPQLSFEDLIRLVPGPDFPTGGIIYGTGGIAEAYRSGRGIIRLRSKTFFEHKKDRASIIVSEIPYQVNKSLLVEELAGLVRDKVVTGIEDIRDESDRDGIRVVIDLKKEANPDTVLNQMLVHSRLDSSFPIALVALVGRVPKQVALRGMIDSFIGHRRDVVRKRTAFLLRNAQDNAHLLEGLLVALKNIDSVISLIRGSDDKASARSALTSQFTLSGKQAEAVLEMKLQRLVSLEQQSIKDEHQQLLKDIADYSSILASESRVSDIIVSELSEIAQKHGDARRTQIVEAGEELLAEDTIKPEEVAVTVTHAGYIKRISVDAYRQQRRGGKGVIAATTKEGDFVENIFVANTHSYILFFTSFGIVHWLKVYEVPEASRYASGKAIVNLLHLRDNEKINAFIPVKEFTAGSLVMVTKNGTIKKTELAAYSNPRRGGIIAITLDDNDELINVVSTTGNQQLIVATKNGLAVRFNEQDVRPVGRSAKGVRAIRLRDSDAVVGMVVANEAESLLTITANGFGKRSPVADYRLISRGGSGVINIQTNDRNGPVAAIASVTGSDDIIIVSKSGNIVRIAAKGTSEIGRNTQGVTLMRLDTGDSVVSIAKVPKEASNGSGNGGNNNESAI